MQKKLSNINKLLNEKFYKKSIKNKSFSKGYKIKIKEYKLAVQKYNLEYENYFCTNPNFKKIIDTLNLK